MASFVFLLELLALFLSSKAIIRLLSQLFFRITQSKKWTAYGLAFIFFPGTVVHELAHLFIAVLLRVHTGELDLFPRLEEGARLDSSARQGVTLGSVKIAHTDSIRRFLIGIAPFVVGLGLIFWVLGYYVGGIGEIWEIGVVGYVLFVIANTMFSSKRDMEGAVPLIVSVVFIVILVYMTGIKVPEEFVVKIRHIVETGSKLLLIPLVINLGIYGVVQLFIGRSRSQT